ncbi:sec-independent protein translocase protein TATA, chloroplastic [Neltuma alba]|uniref:sec-independent protein translocase protein TATA, chloroplastic n=1 Tax=Neltuma alba TaxID=207710 RepID=UPI0010A45ACD|nr:sec-independent protein translocase protein TATA, chloroplastic [Prosopis alba]
MEISSSLTLSLSSSIPRTPVHLPPSSFLVTNSTSTFLKKAWIGIGYPSVRERIRSRTTQSKRGLTCNALFGLGVPELVVIAGVAALVFGPRKLPEVGRSIGKTVKSFQQAAKEFESEIKREPDTIEETSAEKPAAVSEQEKQDIKVSNSKESV